MSCTCILGGSSVVGPPKRMTCVVVGASTGGVGGAHILVCWPPATANMLTARLAVIGPFGATCTAIPIDALSDAFRDVPPRLARFTLRLSLNTNLFDMSRDFDQTFCFGSDAAPVHDPRAVTAAAAKYKRASYCDQQTERCALCTAEDWIQEDWIQREWQWRGRCCWRWW